MSNVDALKELYKEVGGSLTDTYESINDGAPVSDYTLISDVIAACAAKIAGGSLKELPTVAAADNGKILKVVDGAWAAAAATQAVG